MFDELETVVNPHTSTGVSDAMIDQMNEDLTDTIRANSEPTEAELIDMANRETQPTVRTHPEHRDVLNPARDALGRIDPRDAADFLQYVDDWFGTSDRWYVDTAGRVFVTIRISGGEAQACGGHVAQFLAQHRGVVSDVTVDMEPTNEPGLYRPVIVIGSERRPVGYVIPCGTADAARQVGEALAWQERATVMPEVAGAVEGKAA